MAGPLRPHRLREQAASSVLWRGRHRDVFCRPVGVLVPDHCVRERESRPRVRLDIFDQGRSVGRLREPDAAGVVADRRRRT